MLTSQRKKIILEKLAQDGQVLAKTAQRDVWAI